MVFLDIDRRRAGMRVRAWLLIVNFLFNAVALYGLSLAMKADSGWGIALTGVAGTVVCIVVLAQPCASHEREDRRSGCA